MVTEFKLPAPGVASSDHFGTSVSIDGDIAVVGATGHGTPANPTPGAVYFYKRAGGAWILQGTLSNSDPGFLDQFGEAVSVSGDHAIVGASQAGESAQGQAYIFHRQAETWQEQATLAPADGGTFGTFFGRAVALSGDHAVVGANDAAYVFQRSGTIWTQTAKLEPTGIKSGFGHAVAVDGDDLVVGHWASLSGPAKAHVFHRNGATWTPQAELTSGDAKGSDYFGWAVDIDGDRIVVGDFKADVGSTVEAGKAYVFERSGDQWTLVAALEPEAPHKVKEFGWSVGVSGNLVVVGDHGEAGIAPGAGAAYVFARIGGVWVPAAPRIEASDAAEFAYFGRSVALDAGTVLVGAPNDSDPGLYGHGSAYVYDGFPVVDPGAVGVDKWSIYAVILWGLTKGGGGFIVLPGGGGGPVDPEPFKVWSRMSPASRDMYIATMIGEIAAQASHEDARRDIQALALELRKSSERELERERKPSA